MLAGRAEKKAITGFWDVSLETMRLARAVCVPSGLVAVSSYTVVSAGQTSMLPGVPTPPMPGSMMASVAFSTLPHSSWAQPPGAMMLGTTRRYSIIEPLGSCTVTWMLSSVVPPAPVASSR